MLAVSVPEAVWVKFDNTPPPPKAELVAAIAVPLPVATSVSNALPVEVAFSVIPVPDDPVIVVPQANEVGAATQDVFPDQSVCSRFVFDPAEVGSFIVHVPAASAVDRVTVPEVVPLIRIDPVALAAVPMAILEANVGAVPNTSFPDPVSSEITPASSADVVAANADNLSAVYATVPPVQNATELESVPVSVSVLLTVAVFPLATVKVPVLDVIVSPLTVVGVMAPNVNEIAGVVVAVATDQETPFAVVTDTDVTVPDQPPPEEFSDRCGFPVD